MAKEFMLAMLMLCRILAISAKSGEGSSRIFFPLVDSGIPQYPFKITVYGIPIFATEEWSRYKLNHVASVLAELLDQDEDGCADDPLLLNTILEHREPGECFGPAIILDSHDPEDIEISLEMVTRNTKRATEYFSPCIYFANSEDETWPECMESNRDTNCSDSTTEQLFYYLYATGLSETYPSIFGADWEYQSDLSVAMDVARGGYFENIPNEYPAVAWYRNTMPNCDYFCQANIYLWWGYCVFSGMCQNLSGLSNYEREFKYLTKSELENNDIKLSKLFQDSGNGYILPSKQVNGKYYGHETCPSGLNHGGDSFTDFIELLELV